MNRNISFLMLITHYESTFRQNRRAGPGTNV